MERANKSLRATRDGVSSSAVAEDVIGPRASALVIDPGPWTYPPAFRL